jgi:transcriptional regulator with XRE-family HTH domain
METTFDKFITNNAEQKRLFDEEYSEFLLSEFILEKMEEDNISVRELARKAGVSPTVIQKLRGRNADRISYHTFKNVLGILGYKIKLEKIM